MTRIFIPRGWKRVIKEDMLDIVFFNGNQNEYTIVDTTESPATLNLAH